jgi:endoglucanase
VTGVPVTRRTVLAALAAGLVAPALAQAPMGPRVPTRGFALPDWLADTPREPSPALLEQLRATGFETIRLPVAPGFVSPAALGRIAEVLSEVTTVGFNAILDLHPDGDIDADQIQLCWRLLGPVVAATDPARVYAELLNEPPLAPQAWSNLRDSLVDIVRAASPDHTVIWGPARVQGIWELDDTGPLADPNSIVALHYYTPMLFTHQGETWDADPLSRMHDLPFPLRRDMPEVSALAATLDDADRRHLESELKFDWTAARIAADIATLAGWARTHSTPALLGEFGVLDFAVDAASRARWVRAVREAAEANGIGWTYWEADQGFGFVTDRAATGGIDAGIVEALLA